MYLHVICSMVSITLLINSNFYFSTIVAQSEMLEEINAREKNMNPQKPQHPGSFLSRNDETATTRIIVYAAAKSRGLLG